MKIPLSKKLIGEVLLFAGLVTGFQVSAQTNSPIEWIDPNTGHRVIQLSIEPGSESLYFNLNPFTPDGKKMVVASPGGISMINLETRAVENIASGRMRIIMVGRRTGEIYYVTRKIENSAANRIVCSIRSNYKGGP